VARGDDHSDSFDDPATAWARQHLGDDVKLMSIPRGISDDLDVDDAVEMSLNSLLMNMGVDDPLRQSDEFANHMRVDIRPTYAKRAWHKALDALSEADKQQLQDVLRVEAERVPDVAPVDEDTALRERAAFNRRYADDMLTSDDGATWVDRGAVARAFYAAAEWVLADADRLSLQSDAIDDE
jgi:hypothetical protein